MIVSTQDSDVEGTRAFLDGLLERCAAEQASDLHLAEGEPPFLRLHGALSRVEGAAPLGRAEMEGLVDLLVDGSRRRSWEEQRNVDLAYRPKGSPHRFRINGFVDRGAPAFAIRRLDERLRTVEELGLPAALLEAARLSSGLVIVTGPTGSGKSTTIASLIDSINQERAEHIVTIEDPIEYMHRSKRSLVRQREVLSDVPSFADAVRAAMREDPDVILVGEMRDAETARAALSAAETGHLVFSTLHTADAPGAISRLTGLFDLDEQDSIRHEISLVLRMVVAQRLLPRDDVGGRVPGVEVLKVMPAAANLIRTNKLEQLRSIMEAGQTHDMRTLEQSLAELTQAGQISEAVARRAARDLQAFEASLHQHRARGAATGRPLRRRS